MICGMQNVCKESGLTGKDMVGCKEEANIMSGGVKMLGCSAYMVCLANQTITVTHYFECCHPHGDITVLQT